MSFPYVVLDLTVTFIFISHEVLFEQRHQCVDIEDVFEKNYHMCFFKTSKIQFVFTNIFCAVTRKIKHWTTVMACIANIWVAVSINMLSVRQGKVNNCNLNPSGHLEIKTNIDLTPWKIHSASNQWREENLCQGMCTPKTF